MLINRLYKSKNNPSNNKQLPKPDQETNLLFYVSLYIYTSKLRKNHLKRRKTKKYCLFLLAPKGLPYIKMFHLLMLVWSLPEGPAEAILLPIKKSRRLETACQ